MGPRRVSTSRGDPCREDGGHRLGTSAAEPVKPLLRGVSHQYAFFVSIGAGVLFGIVSALKQYSWLDYLITTFAFFGQSMPVFWFGLMLQLAFSVVGITAFGYHLSLPSAGIA